MNTYETIYILAGEVTQDQANASLDKVKTIILKSEGTIRSTEHWGRRRLAYPINRNKDGYYIYLSFKAAGTAPAQLDRFFRVTEGILRGITISIDEKVLEKMKSPPRPQPTEPQSVQPPVTSVPAEFSAPAQTQPSTQGGAA